MGRRVEGSKDCVYICSSQREKQGKIEGVWNKKRKKSPTRPHFTHSRFDRKGMWGGILLRRLGQASLISSAAGGGFLAVGT